MKPIKEEDSRLRELLHQWEPQAPLPPRFQEQVWRRIEGRPSVPDATETAGSLWAAWLAARLPRPAFATAYLVLVLGLGAALGCSHAREKSDRVLAELGVLYLQTIDPFHQAP